MRGHRGLAVGRDPGRREATILAWMQPQGALALLLEDKAVVDDPALASRPGRGMLVVDARPDRIDRGQVVAAHGFDPEQDLAAVRVEAVPGVAKAARHLAAVGGWAGRAGRRGGSGGIAPQLWIG